MKQFILLFTIVLIGFFAFSQEDDDGDKFGANKTHFVHSYLNIGFMTPPDEGEGADLLYGKSHSITYGVRYKLRIADFFAIGAGVNYTYNVWHLKQNDSKAIPTNVTYDKEKLFSNNLGGDAFLRFNIGKRTNTVGNFIDLGGYGEWAFGRTRKATNMYEGDPADDPTSYEYATSALYKLDYMEKINYGLLARIGYGRYVLFGRYRLSNIFTQDFKDALENDAEFPRIIVGVEVGFHK